MKFLKVLLAALLVITSLAVAKPSLADPPKYLSNPDYIEITKNLDILKSAPASQTQLENYTPEQLQTKIDALEFQKYALESGISWGQCQNLTGKTLAVYGPKAKKDSENNTYDSTLYFLADGQTTKKKWDCQGIYVPSDATIAVAGEGGAMQQLAGPLAIKIVDGTKLAIGVNAETSALELSSPPAQVAKAGEINWFIPNVDQLALDARIANAPVAKAAKS